jgi:hypothetical protein
VLASNLESPLVSNTLVTSDFVESFDVLSELGFKDIGSYLQVLALFIILLSVKEPSGDTVSLGVSNDVSDTVTLCLGELSGSDLGVDSEDFADEESVPSADTLDLIKGIWDCSLAVDIGVQNTMDMLEGAISVLDD